jgi:hypothetical protein
MAESGSLPTLKLFPEDVPSLEWVVEQHEKGKHLVYIKFDIKVVCKNK